MKRERAATAPAWLALAVGFVAAGVRIGSRPLDDNSFLTHLATGRLIVDGGVPSSDPYSFTAAGHDWVVQSWLASLVYGAVDAAAGGYGLLALNAVLVALLALAAFALTRPTASVIGRLGLGMLAVAVGAGAWSERPLLFGLLCLAGTLLVVERQRSPWWLVPLFAVWVNTHGSFPLGVVALLALAAGERLDGGRPDRELRAALMAAGGAVAGALVTLQPRLLTFPLDLLGRSDILRGVIEWRAPTFEVGWQRLWLLQLVVAVLLLVRRPRWRAAVPLVVFSAAALLAARNIAVASLIVLPAMAAAVGAVGTLRADQRSRGALVASLAAVGVVGLIAVSAASRPPFTFERYPVRQLALTDDLGGRRAAPDFAGNLLEAAEGEDAAVFYDDRFDLFPDQVSLDYRRLLNGAPGWERVLDRYEIDTVVWRRTESLSALLTASPAWQIRYVDSDWVTAVRRPPS